MALTGNSLSVPLFPLFLLYRSPCGWIRLRGEGGRLCRVELLDGRAAAGRTTGPREERLARFAEMLDGYFDGRPMNCPAALLRLDGASRFSRRVYESLREVPFGETVSYGELARMCGRPGAARAVGRALGANPTPIFVPCHRVVRKDGSPGGFSAGLRWKERLLGHEGGHAK